MEVHPPHHALNSWHDFFIHIGTITVGLLIAIGLEQTVEAIHHHRELTELRESLDRDSEKAIVDATLAIKAEKAKFQWINERTAQVRKAMQDHSQIAALPSEDRESFDLPDYPAWKAAKSSGQLTLMSQQEIKAYSEIDFGMTELQKASEQELAAYRKSSQFEAMFTHLEGSGAPDFAGATQQDLRQYLELLMDERGTTATFSSFCVMVRGALEAVLHGERDLNKIQHAEGAAKP